MPLFRDIRYSLTGLRDRIIETALSALRQVITAETLTLLFAVGIVATVISGYWFRASRLVALSGWELITGTGSQAAYDAMQISARVLLGVAPLIALAAGAAAIAGIVTPALRRRLVPLIAVGGIVNLSVILVYLIVLALSPSYNRTLDLGLWLALALSAGLVIQLFFNRPSDAIALRTRFTIMGVTIVVNAALYFVTLATEIARSRENESVAFEITALVGMALYGALIGSYITHNIFRRKGQNPRVGRALGAIVGAFGHLLLLIPLWIYTPTSDDAPRQRIRIDEVAWASLMLAPWLISFVLLTVCPTLGSYRVALYNWQGFGEPTQFVGLRHIENVIKDPFFWKSLGNTLTYALVLVPIQLSLSLILAIVLTRKRMRFASFYRTIYFLPAVTSVAVVAVVMRLILGNFGSDLSALLGIDPPINPISDPTLALVSVIVFGIWHSFGVNLVYFLAALQTVPEELYDAAQVDGANWFEQLLHVTLPSIRPIAVIILFMAFLGSMYVFEQSFVLTRGGPYFASQVVSGYIYNYAFRQPGTQLTPNFGYASAAALFFALIMLTLTVTNYLVTQRLRARQ
ncbi:MAG: sugar ABC transporter permease [Chloroflexota bacterium]|nr:sugar ABC transporter permease [Chloroflexota bacterium]